MRVSRTKTSLAVRSRQGKLCDRKMASVYEDTMPDAFHYDRTANEPKEKMGVLSLKQYSCMYMAN